jgi:ATP/maltotriose-dependent transcriptional regulator MalT
VPVHGVFHPGEYVGGLARAVHGDRCAVYEQALVAMRERRIVPHYEALMLAHLADAHRERGDVEQAHAIAEEAVVVARARCTKGQEIDAHLALARALLQSGRGSAPAAVEAVLARALVLVEETGARCHEPFIRIELARLAGLTGDGTLAGSPPRRQSEPAS